MEGHRLDTLAVVASQFDIVEAGAVAQGVVGEVQDMVSLVVGELELEQGEPLVVGLGQPEFPYQQLNGTDPAARDRAGLDGDFVMDVSSGEDRLGRGCDDRSIEPLEVLLDNTVSGPFPTSVQYGPNPTSVSPGAK